jgi:hypothetical protein
VRLVMDHCLFRSVLIASLCFHVTFILQPELRCEYLLNLSISVSRGKETNKDSRSNGE